MRGIPACLGKAFAPEAFSGGTDAKKYPTLGLDRSQGEIKI